jgi:hypothetical protein
MRENGKFWQKNQQNRTKLTENTVKNEGKITNLCRKSTKSREIDRKYFGK